MSRADATRVAFPLPVVHGILFSIDIEAEKKNELSHQAFNKLTFTIAYFHTSSLVCPRHTHPSVSVEAPGMSVDVE
eukprot:6884570-Karenia_brevis.AAC.1